MRGTVLRFAHRFVFLHAPLLFRTPVAPTSRDIPLSCKQKVKVEIPYGKLTNFWEHKNLRAAVACVNEAASHGFSDVDPAFAGPSSS